MFFSPGEILNLLEQYKYFIIFPITVVEGPIIIIVSGFLSYLKILNFYGAFLMLSFADIIGDSLYYLIGRYWRISEKARKFARYFGYDEKSEESLEKYFEAHKGKTFLVAKVSHGIGSTVQIASGIAKVSYKIFLFYSVLGTLPKTYILLIIGYYLGNYYEKIDGYLGIFAFVTVGFFALFIIYMVSNKYVRRYFNNNKDTEKKI
jgi:membrane protein DedA with SNARE-associated domain